MLNITINFRGKSLYLLFITLFAVLFISTPNTSARSPWSSSPLYSPPTRSTSSTSYRPPVSRVRPEQPIYKPGGCMPSRPHACGTIGVSKKTYRRSVRVYGPVNYGSYIPVPVQNNSQPSVTNIYINNNIQNQPQQQKTPTTMQRAARPAPREPVCPGNTVTSVDPATGAVSLSYTSSPGKCR